MKGKLTLCLYFLVLILQNDALAKECVIVGTERPLLKITMFPYSGAEDGEPKNQLSNFKQYLTTKIDTLYEEIFSDFQSGQHAASHVTSLSLSKLSSSAIFPTDFLNYWKETYSLYLLSGSIGKKNENYFADSRVFLGTLAPNSLNDVNVKIPILPEQARFTKDTHSFMTYYSLAEDAFQRNCSSGTVMYFLSKAQSILTDIENNNGVFEQLSDYKKLLESKILFQRNRPVL